MTKVEVKVVLLRSELRYVEKLSRLNKSAAKPFRFLLGEVLDKALRLTTVAGDAIAWSCVPLRSVIAEPLSFAVDATVLLNLTRFSAEEEALSLHIEGDTVTVAFADGGSHGLINDGEIASQIRERTHIRDLTTLDCQVTAAQLRHNLGTAVRFTCKKPHFKPDLRAVFLELVNGSVRAASSDGYVVFESGPRAPAEPVISAGLYRQLVPVLTAISPIADDVVDVTTAGDLVCCSCPPRGFGFAGAPGNLPQLYKYLQSSDGAAVISMNTDELRSALLCLSSLRQGRYRRVRLEAVPPATLVMSAASPDQTMTGEHELTAEVSRKTGVEFNPDSVLGFLRLVSGPLTVEIHKNKPPLPRLIVFSADNGMRFATAGFADNVGEWNGSASQPPKEADTGEVDPLEPPATEEDWQATPNKLEGT